MNRYLIHTLVFCPRDWTAYSSTGQHEDNCWERFEISTVLLWRESWIFWCPETWRLLWPGCIIFIFATGQLSYNHPIKDSLKVVFCRNALLRYMMPRPRRPPPSPRLHHIWITASNRWVVPYWNSVIFVHRCYRRSRVIRWRLLIRNWDRHPLPRLHHKDMLLENLLGVATLTRRYVVCA